eukprot:14115195-Heterocapsa_arctica.AAC.1
MRSSDTCRLLILWSWRASQPQVAHLVATHHHGKITHVLISELVEEIGVSAIHADEAVPDLYLVARQGRQTLVVPVSDDPGRHDVRHVKDAVAISLQLHAEALSRPLADVDR